MGVFVACLILVSTALSPAEVRALHAVWKKGLAFWEARLKKTEVGKHSKNKVGAPLKRVCKKSEARGCRASGGGRKDRFQAYKAAVKNCFTLELDNGQEVACSLVSKLQNKLKPVFPRFRHFCGPFNKYKKCITHKVNLDTLVRVEVYNVLLIPKNTSLWVMAHRGPFCGRCSKGKCTF